MVNRIISVGDDFTLPASLKATDANLPAASKAAAIALKLDKTEAATSYAAKSVETSKLDASTAATTYAAKSVETSKLDATTAATTYAAKSVETSKLDKTEAAATYGPLLVTSSSIVAAADYDLNFTAGKYTAEGVAQTQATVFTTTAARDGAGKVLSYKATTNIAPSYPFAGGTVGAIGSGGAFPTGLSNAVSGAPKTIVSIAPNSLIYSATPSGQYFGGFRVAAWAPGSDVLVSFDMEITGAGNTPVTAFLSWFDGGVAKNIASFYTSLEGAQRVTVRLPNPGVASQINFFVEAASTAAATGLTLTIKLENLLISVAPTSNKHDLLHQPPYAAVPATASTSTISCSDGDYKVVVFSDQGGTFNVDATAAGGTGINLTALLPGSLAVSRVLVFKKATYQDAWLDILDPPRWVNVPAFYHYGLARKAQKRASGYVKSTGYSQAPAVAASTRRSLQYAENRLVRTRHDVRPGEVAATDGPTQIRSEYIDEGYRAQFGVEQWVYDEFVFNRLLTTVGTYAILWQFRYTNDAGDTSGMSPDMSLALGDNGTIAMVTRSSAVNGGSSQTNPVTISDPLSTVTPATVTRWSAPVVAGQKYRVLTRVVISNSGGGELQCWLNGVQVFNATVPVGYNRALGPGIHFGSYRNNSTESLIVEHVRFEYGTESLLHLK